MSHKSKLIYFFVALLIVTTITLGLFYSKTNIRNDRISINPSEAKLVIAATDEFISKHFGAGAPENKELQEPFSIVGKTLLAKKDLKKPFVVITNGFYLENSKWIFLKCTNHYIGIHDDGDYVISIIIEKKGPQMLISSPNDFCGVLRKGHEVNGAAQP